MLCPVLLAAAVVAVMASLQELAVQVAVEMLHLAALPHLP
jgi:hypothetical protein